MMMLCSAFFLAECARGRLHDKLAQYAFILLQYVTSLMSSAAFLVPAIFVLILIIVCNLWFWQMIITDCIVCSAFVQKDK